MGRQALLRDLTLTVYLAQGLVDHLLAIRVHETLSRSGVKALRSTAQLADTLLDSALCLVETGLSCCQTGLLGRFKRSAHALAKARLLGSLLRHDGRHPGVIACALKALEGLTEIRGPRLSGRAHGLAKRHVLCHKSRLARCL